MWWHVDNHDKDDINDWGDDYYNYWDVTCSDDCYVWMSCNS